MQTYNQTLGNLVQLKALTATDLQTNAYQNNFIAINAVEPSLGYPTGTSNTNPLSAYFFPLLGTETTYLSSRRTSGLDTLYVKGSSLYVNTSISTPLLSSNSVVGSGNQFVISDGYGTNNIGNGANTISLNALSGTYIANKLIVGTNNIAINTSSVLGGIGNKANGIYSAVAGGGYNTASGNYSSVVGGSSNTASNAYANIAGGSSNIANSTYSTVVGGFGNTSSGPLSIAGGYSNTASGTNSSALGGQSNTASGANASVTGGASNSASGNCSTVSGGYQNNANGNYSSVVGGSNHTVSGNYSAILGGNNNQLSGSCSTIAGGINNTLSGNNSFILGSNINASQANYTYVNNLSSLGNVYASKIFSSNTINKAVTSIGNGVNTAFNFVHNLNTQDVITQVYSNTNNIVVTPTIANISTTTVSLSFSTPPASNAYRVVVIG